jgi:hypothetical protein
LLTGPVSDHEAEVLDLTLLGAVRDGDSVLVAADSSVWRSDGMGSASYQGTATKFRRLRSQLPETLVLFGAYGDQDVGERIAAWLERSTAWGNWNELVRVAGDMLRRANTAEGVTKDAITHAMVAGSIQGELGIERIGPYGATEANENPAFLGNGRVAAQVGWDIAAEAAPAMSNEERLRLVMRRTTMAVVPLGPPLCYWRVTSDGVEELESDTSGFPRGL